MMPFNGVNEHSILIIDNRSVHHVQVVKDLVKQAEILLLFLPAYSPDLNPIEEAFNFVKHYLRKHETVLHSITDPTDIIKHAFDRITPTHLSLASWLYHTRGDS